MWFFVLLVLSLYFLTSLFSYSILQLIALEYLFRLPKPNTHALASQNLPRWHGILFLYCLQISSKNFYLPVESDTLPWIAQLHRSYLHIFSSSFDFHFSPFLRSLLTVRPSSGTTRDLSLFCPHYFQWLRIGLPKLLPLITDLCVYRGPLSYQSPSLLAYP